MELRIIHLIIILVALLVLLYFVKSRGQSNDSALPAFVVSEHQQAMDKKLGVKQ
jgi:hypothetical protein